MNSKTVVSIIGVGVVALGALFVFSGRRPPSESLEDAPQASKDVATRRTSKGEARGGRSDGMAQQIERLSEQRRAGMDGWSGTHGGAEGESIHSRESRSAESARRHGNMKGSSKADSGSDDDTPEFDNAKRTALTDNDSAKRLEALETLESFDDERVLPVLAQVLNDRDPEVRMAALEQLANFDEDVPFETFANVIYDPDPEVRAEVLRILADSEDERVVALARSALNDPDEDVRAEAQDIVDFASN